MDSWTPDFNEIIEATEMWHLVTVTAACAVGLSLYWVASRGAALWAARTETPADDHVIAEMRSPSRLLFPLLAMTVSWPFHNGAAFWNVTHHALVVLTILCTGWLLVRGVRAAEQTAANALRKAGADVVTARSSRTRLRVFTNVAIFLVVLLTVAATLMTFDVVREIGLSLFASAGAAGIVVGFAAQRSIATVFAGLQLALTQPIRVDDVVIIEGQWGRIEEINLTYVVVCIWDQRRLVVPINYFIEKPFENWTRNSSELLGTVYLYSDYTLPVPELRAHVRKVCEDSDLWDGRVASLVVTASREHTLELRALVSAADSSKLWDLRCHLREALVAYVQAHHPQCLPRFRGELGGHSTG